MARDSRGRYVGAREAAASGSKPAKAEAPPKQSDAELKAANAAYADEAMKEYAKGLADYNEHWEEIENKSFKQSLTVPKQTKPAK